MKKCLVVDDVEVTRFTSEQIITSLGLHAVTVATAEEAFSAMEDETFDLILLDWHLRKASGLDILQKLKSDSGSHPRVIVFSGVEGAEKQAEAIKAGADAFLEKPTTKDKLANCLKEIGFS